MEMETKMETGVMSDLIFIQENKIIISSFQILMGRVTYPFIPIM